METLRYANRAILWPVLFAVTAVQAYTWAISGRWLALSADIAFGSLTVLGMTIETLLFIESRKRNR